MKLVSVLCSTAQNMLFIAESSQFQLAQLLEKGRTVVAAARDASKAEEVFRDLGLSEGLNKGFGTVQTPPPPSLSCRTDPCAPTLHTSA